MVTINQLASGAKAAAIDSLKPVSTKDMNVWAGLRIAILAPPGKGKTHLACTASAKYTVWPPVEPVDFDDILFVEADPSGLILVKEAGVEITRVIDIGMKSDEEIVEVLFEIPKVVLQEVLAKPTRLVCFDTFSTIFKALGNVRAGGGLDGPKLYNALAGETRRFMSALRPIPCPILFNCHIKEPQMVLSSKSGSGPDLEGSRVAMGLDSVGQLIMDLPGKDMVKAVDAAGTLVGFLECIDMPGGKCKREIDFDSSRVQTKRRLSICVDRKEPAHLGQLFSKIAAGCKVPVI